MKGVTLGVLFVGVFVIGIGIANLTGYWENKVSKKTYFFHMMTQGLMVKVKPNVVDSKSQRMKLMIEMMKKKRNSS